MKQEAEILRRAEKMAPLMHSIVREARERSRAIHVLETARKRALHRPGARIEHVRRIEVELFAHRRGLEQVHSELARLGCSMDPDRPERIVWALADREITFEEWLGETGFRRRI